VTFKARTYVCDCGATVTAWRWNTDPTPTCLCGRVMDEQGTVGVPAPGIIPDTIPGGIYIRHGLCHADGTPRRFDSMTEIRRAAAAKGLTLYGETPKAPTCDGHVDRSDR